MSISTLSFNNATRATLMRLQGELKTANTEMVNERYADVGAALGRLTGTAVSYRVQETSIVAQIETNKVITGRLEIAGDVMAAAAGTAEELGASLLGAEKYNDYPQLARSALLQLQGALNTSVGGVYVFGGRNAGEAPIKGIEDGIDAAKQKFGDFLAGLGKTAEQVTAAEMAGFLSADGYEIPAGTLTPGGAPAPGEGDTFRFMETVDDAGWAANWSTASDDPTTAAISRSETIETSLSANREAFRKLAASYSMLAAVAGEKLSEGAKKALTQGAAVTLRGGLDGVTALRADVGVREKRIDMASEALDRQKAVVEAAFMRLEGVDQTEAGMRVTQLETLLKASYTVTGRLQNLSILDYI